MTVTLCPTRESAMAAERPEIEPPTMRNSIWRKSGVRYTADSVSF